MANMREQIAELNRRIGALEDRINTKNEEISLLKEQLDAKQWPALEAIEDFESEVGKAVQKLIGKIK